MLFLSGLIIGAYLMPAILDGWSIWKAEYVSGADLADSIATAIVGGVIWPFAPRRSEPMD